MGVHEAVGETEMHRSGEKKDQKEICQRISSGYLQVVELQSFKAS